MNRFSVKMTAPIFVWMSVALSGTVEAATITRGKGQHVLIEFTNDEPLPVVAQRMMVTQNDGKTLGWVEISKVGERKAVAKILKGQAPVGANVGTTSRSQASTESTLKSRSHKRSDTSAGVTLGVVMDQQSLTAENVEGTLTESIQLRGFGYRFRAYLEKTLYGGLGVVGRAGLEVFDVRGNSQEQLCSNTSSCRTKITFAAAEALVKYTFFDGWGGPFLFGGGGIYYPLSASSSILEVESLSTTQFLVGGVGAKVDFSDNWFMPIQLEYGFLPSSSGGHSTRFLGLQTGLTAEF